MGSQVFAEQVLSSMNSIHEEKQEKFTEGFQSVRNDNNMSAEMKLQNQEYENKETKCLEASIKRVKPSAETQPYGAQDTTLPKTEVAGTREQRPTEIPAFEKEEKIADVTPKKDIMEMIEERFARTSNLKEEDHTNLINIPLPENEVKIVEEVPSMAVDEFPLKDVPGMNSKGVEKTALEDAQETVPSKDDTLWMIEQRRKATQDRIKAHLNGLDKNTEEQEKKESENVLANEERAPVERGSQEVPAAQSQLTTKPPTTDSKKAPGQPTDVTREKLSIANNLEQNEPDGIILAKHPKTEDTETHKTSCLQQKIW